MSDFAVEHFVHKGSMWSHNFKPDLSRCRFSVAEHGRVTDWHQCNRKPVEKVEGYDFCKQHANEVKSRLGIRTDATKTRYATSFLYGKPNLVKLEVLGETNSTIEVSGCETILGSGNGLYRGRQRKDSQYTRQYCFFDNHDDAILWLYQQSEENWRSAVENLQKSIETMNKMKEILQNAVEQRR